MTLRPSGKASCRFLMTVVLLLFFGMPLMAQEPGDVLEITSTGTVQPGQIGSGANYAVDTYTIRFASTALDGSITPITAQLFVPQLQEAEERPVYVFGPGSTGLIDRCAPSREHIAGINWGQYRAHILVHARQGKFGILPDYMGFGVPDMNQPYFSAVAEGRVMLDAIRAVHNFAATQETTARPGGAFIAGYSQGGHAAFAAADLQADYAPDVPILGIIGYGPTTNIQALFREFTVVAPMVTYVYANLYGAERFDPNAILQDRWLGSLTNDVTSQCIGGIQSFYPWEAANLFREDFNESLHNDTLQETHPEIHAIMEENNTGLTGHGIPALILQGTDDPVVFVSSQNAFVHRLCETGAPVQYLHYIGTRHDTRVVGFGEALEWMDLLAQGETAPSNCPD
jgi:pimeloyl-ACP methyl ester carboxylesterase